MSKSGPSALKTPIQDISQQLVEFKPGEGHRLFIASDFHLGAPNPKESLEREKRIVRWLDSIKDQARILVLLGDVFDFWYEYRSVVPRGFVRFLGKLAELSDKGCQVLVFGGNHDMWHRGYFEKEFNALYFEEPIRFHLSGKVFLLHHGDGLGPTDIRYKLIRKVFTSRVARFLFRQLHPDLSSFFAHSWSSHSRDMNHKEDAVFLGEKEWLWTYAKEMEKQHHHDYYIFGHRHLPMDLPVGYKGRYLNSGEWITYNSFVQFDGTEALLGYFENDQHVHLEHQIEQKKKIHT